MALSNLNAWRNNTAAAGSSCGTACGASEKADKPAACGTACGASGKTDKPAACGTACGAGDK